MRTLKKTLALVLVVAMMMSLCITSNAAFTDAKEIKYTEAVEVLTAIGVIDGFPSGEFQPQGSLTRAQAAKILVYILGAENIAKADGQIFDDVAPNHWAADYIAYCAENELVNGYGDGKFGPEDKLTGYQWAKMLLAALGEDTTAMIGAAWQIPVAKAANAYGLFAGNLAADKTEIATREEACQYALNALTYGGYYAYEVYEKATGATVGYYDTVAEASLVAIAKGPAYTVSAYPVYVSNASLLYVVHDVDFGNTRDDWGRPMYVYAGLWGGANQYLYLEYKDTPDAVYTTAVTECDVAEVLGYYYAGDYDVNTYVNGLENNSVTAIDPVETKATIGGQGRIVEVYNNRVDDIVIIDTYLAKVDKVVASTYDAAGHMKTPAYLYLTVYDRADGIKVVETSYFGDYSYAQGDMLLVHAQTWNSTAYTTNNTVDLAVAAANNGYAVAAQLEVVGYATSTVGAQSYVYSDNSRTVAGVKYPSNVEFHQDATNKVVSNTNYTWYFDQFNNLIGSFKIDTVYNYGIIENIQWINPELANGYAQATIRYVNGEKAVVKVASLCNDGLTYQTTGNAVGHNGTAWVVSTSLSENNRVYAGTALYRIEDLGARGVALVNVNQYGAGDVKTGVATIAAAAGTVKVNNDTIFVVRTNGLSGYIYTNYEGYTAVPTMTGATVIDWVAAPDGSAKYVYVVGETDAALSANIVHIKDADSWFYDNARVLYTLTDAYVAGVQTDVVIPAAKMAGLKDDTVYVVTYSNGVVSTITEVTSGMKVDANKNIYALVSTVTAIENDVIVANGIRWNVEDTPVYGGELKIGSKIVLLGGVNDSTDSTAIYVIG